MCTSYKASLQALLQHTLPVVRDVCRLRIDLLLFLCSFEVGLEGSCDRLLQIDSLWVISAGMENSDHFSLHCLHKAEPASQELVHIFLQVSEDIMIVVY